MRSALLGFVIGFAASAVVVRRRHRPDVWSWVPTGDEQAAIADMVATHLAMWLRHEKASIGRQEEQG